MATLSCTLLGKCHGQKSRAGCRLWGHRVGHDWVSARMNTDGQTALAFNADLCITGGWLHLLNRNRKPSSTLGVSRAPTLPGSPVFSSQEADLGPALWPPLGPRGPTGQSPTQERSERETAKARSGNTSSDNRGAGFSRNIRNRTSLLPPGLSPTQEPDRNLRLSTGFPEPRCDCIALISANQKTATPLQATPPRATHPAGHTPQATPHRPHPLQATPLQPRPTPYL